MGSHANRHAIRRRTLVRGATGAAALGALALPLARAGGATGAPAPRQTTYRAAYHFTVPDQWKNDPQRPVFIDGSYHYYYLYNADYTAGGVGTAWRLATTTDLVAFADQGVAVPKDTTANGDVWSGSAVVDTGNTAGFGAGAVVVLVTMEPGGANTQAQYLWYSTDEGRTFTHHGTEPVLANPGVVDFRDPKVIWDADRGRWVMTLAENNKIGFYTSPNLREWTYVSGFIKDGIGVLECPDLFRIATAEGTAKWVLGASANGKASGLPNTYAYWTGEFDGTTFTADAADPQWLDHGWDWYAAVTWEKHDADGSIDPAVRYALGWLNNWDYANTTPTIDADGFNGTDSIVREITLVRQASGSFTLLSRPVPALDDHVTGTVELGEVQVGADAVVDLDYTGVAYELTCTVSWETLTGAGVQLRKSADGARHVDAGVHNDYAFLNRSFTTNPDSSGNWQESHSPFDPATARQVRMRVLVDRTSVEVFFDDGRYVHTHEVFPPPEDAGIALYTIGGAATFGGVTIRELG
jgi:levanbiose-producing levanase